MNKLGEKHVDSKFGSQSIRAIPDYEPFSKITQYKILTSHADH